MEGHSRGSVAEAGGARRRRPTQQRSQRRLEAILEAAAESFAEHGFSDTTMEGIAARAGTSIGSLYQFFPNKTAVFREVAQRCMQLARQGYAQLLGPDPVRQPWSELLSRFIDGFRRLHQSNVMMQAVWRNLEIYGEYAEADEALLRELVQATAALFAGWVPTLGDERREVVATMVVNTVASMMLVLARDPDPVRGDAIVEETKLMLVRYLSVYLGEPAGR
ncbi:TetR/AcrR family transcriptional regulator [Paraliomyxa miuraensis]|uniref:TetR/AcrR family transcriptional regulator n=1 Tax=Paraliomyxa miuraensis TaxID=376150 RepID=UPI00225388AB|nr:TetR/AcrR family transcriptional regulator [Paraliomyxa miuraensis]MCX4247962.1 TetR/AcrR family transcriptional regulator [Paraliomyxa miuraensis]